MEGDPTPKDLEDVEVWADCGGTFWWEGTASRSTGLLVSGVDPHGISKETGDSEGEDPRPVHSGRPGWVPTDWVSG